MFKTAIVGAAALLVNNVSANYVLGKCPKIKTDWQGAHPNEKLDVSKIVGSWAAIWESYVRQLHWECVQIKIKAIEG